MNIDSELSIKKHIFCIFSFLILFGFFLDIQPTRAEESSIGQIDKVIGHVIIEKEDQTEIAGNKGTYLFPGDIIRTEEDGTVWFTLHQSQQFKLSQDSRMEIDELSGTETEDNLTSVRLVLGYLWSKVRKHVGKSRGLTIHTPTTIIGIRGTEFDSVVSLDSSTVVAVDEGIVEIEDEGNRQTINQNEMIQVEFEGKPGIRTKFIPKGVRDWQAWQKKRMEDLFKKLPRIVPRLRSRFEIAAKKTNEFNSKVQTAIDNLNNTMERVRNAAKSRKPAELARAKRQLQAQITKFNKMVDGFREASNRVKTMSGISFQMQKYAVKNKDRFKKDDLIALRTDFIEIAQKRAQLKSTFQKIFKDIKDTYRELNTLKRQLKNMRNQ